MKFTLHDYQAQAVAEVLDELDEARRRFDGKRSKETAVSLTAVTGAGKTVMATAVLEALLCGNDEGVEPDPDATVLWLTDNPALNEQTRRKMLVASSRLAAGQLMTIDEDNPLDQATLDPSRVYFLNIHKLGKGATNFVAKGDRRQYTLWETLRQTIRERGSSFLLVIDEAHRGTSGSNGRGSIASQIIAGDPALGVPPTPIVLGISATPERFNSAVTASGRALHPVEVDVDEVRQSGLIKDMVGINFPTETQPGDITLVEQAVEDVLEYDERWSAHADEHGTAEVRPVLVVQVPPGISDAGLATLVETIHGAWDDLKPNAIGHAFQEHTRLDLGDRALRYVAPQDIQDDPHLRVVLFKEALTTGWDCPRAEVMVSLRSASDHTYIAQLIGRMVRTPLARRIESSELLNSVSLYLPHFDRESVGKVVEVLRAGEDKVASEISTNAVTCSRDDDLDDAVWESLEKVPTYTRPAKAHRNQVARLNQFAHLLAVTGVAEDAPAKAKQHIVSTMDQQAKRLGKKLTEEVEQLGTLDYQRMTVTTFDTGKDSVVADRARSVSGRNVDDLYRKARRAFGDAAADWYWDHLQEQQEQAGDQPDPRLAKLTVAALSHDAEAVAAVHTAAEAYVGSLRTEHNAAIGQLDEEDRQRVYAIYKQSHDPQLIELTLPTDITVDAPEGVTEHDKHIYNAPSGKFPAAVNDWEQAVLDKRLPGAVAWYRNPTAGSRAVAVPYTVGTEQRTMYPDFILLRKTGDKVVADILDPHDPSRSDCAPKWVGLAEYATEHKDDLGQVLAIIRSSQDEEMWSLDLRSADVRDALAAATTEQDIRKVFQDHGGKL